MEGGGGRKRRRNLRHGSPTSKEEQVGRKRTNNGMEVLPPKRSR
jgi:hypothetical protein